jgi:hypothetical protein
MNGLANRINTRFDGYHGLDTRYHGLVIDKSTSSQTICQTNNIIKPGIWGISPNHVFGYIGYRGYTRYKGLSKYRPNTAISHTETLNVSHNGIGGYMGRVYKETPNHSYWTYNTYDGYKGLNGLRLNGLINKILWFFLFWFINPVRVLTKPPNHKQ